MDTGMTTAAQKVAYAQACAETLPAGQLRATALAAAALARIRLELGATGAVAPAAAIACALAGDGAFAHESHYHYRSDPPDFVASAAAALQNIEREDPMITRDETHRWRDDLFTDDDGAHWRGFATHSPSGDVYVLEQDSAPGCPGNCTGVFGPVHHSEITREYLEDFWNIPDDDNEWAAGETWVPISHPRREPWI